MPKKRSCRRTDDENRIHEKAVKMRKMTDEQLVHYVEDRVAKAESEGYNRGKRSGADIKAFIQELGELNGIGSSTVNKIKEYAISKGYLEGGEADE